MINAIVGQSGGPTAAINASLSGVIKACRESGKIDTLYGALFGIQGVFDEQFCSLFEEVPDNHAHYLLETTPASALGSCRKKLPNPDESAKDTYEKLFGIFEKYEIKYFFYIGGNDSMDTVHKLSVWARNTGSDIRFIGVPKTIDNDLSLTDHTPGFGSAAKYLASSCAEMIRDTEVYNTDAVTIIEIMGRDAGWLTACSALSRLVDGTAPDLVYLPEVDFSTEDFISDVKAKLKNKHNVVVAVSEGIRDKDGIYVGESSQSGKTDAFGHKYLSGTGKVLEELVREKIGCKVRSVEINILQRCASHLSSKTDIDESVEVGRFAVSLALSGKTGSMAAFERVSTNPYVCKCTEADLDKVANAVRSVPLDFIVPEKNNVTDECLSWIMPLIQGEVSSEFNCGVPVHFKIKK
jgi:6-phosphofructokinase 1